MGETIDRFTDKFPNFVIRGFASEQECKELRTLADAAEEKQSATVGSDRRKDTSVRNNVTAYVRERPSIRDRVDKLLVKHGNADVSKPEPVQVQIYGPGEFYSAHTDSWPIDDVCNRGVQQRNWTCVLYLNDVEKGGTTSFPKVGVKLSSKRDPTKAPEKGTLACWNNLVPGTSEPQPLSEHKGDAVEAGEKYLANFWYNVGVKCPPVGQNAAQQVQTTSSSWWSGSIVWVILLLLVLGLVGYFFLSMV